MPFTHIALTLEIFFVGLLAGFELAVHYGMGDPPSALSAEAQIVLRQALIRRLRVLAPSLFLPSLLLAIVTAFCERHQPGLWYRYVSVAMLLLWIAIRIVRTVPENIATLEWDPIAPPKDWRLRVAKTERFHVIAAWAAVVAFISSLLNLLNR